MSKLKIPLIIAFILFLGLQIANHLIVKAGYKLNFEFWTSIKSEIMLFALTGLSAYLLFLLYIKSKNLKALGSVFAIVSLLLLGFIALWESEGIRSIENADYKIHVIEYRFLFSGEDTLYQKENFFYSKKIGTYTQSDDNYVFYEIEEEQLVITDTWYGYPEADSVQVYYVDLG